MGTNHLSALNLVQLRSAQGSLGVEGLEIITCLWRKYVFSATPSQNRERMSCSPQMTDAGPGSDSLSLPTHWVGFTTSQNV